MKKFYLGLCIVLLALVLISCGGKKDEDSKTTAKDAVTVSESSKEQEEKSVSESEEKAESLFETVADKAKEIVQSKTFTKKDVLDDFGEPTGNFSYNSKAFRGTYKTMEQSGNTSGGASLYISVDNNKKVFFKVVEDGNTGHFMGAKYTTDKFSIVIREENGKDVNLKDIPIIQDENKLYNTFKTGIFWTLIRNKTVKLVIKNENATYNFNSIDTSELEGLFLDKGPYEKAVTLKNNGKYQEALDILLKYKTESSDSFIYYSGTDDELLRECSKGVGAAGGCIFYDCDADNDSGNADGLKSSECGWRYLEAAPTDILDSNGKEKGFCWGDDGKKDSDRFGTKKGIGEGKNNTKIIVEQASKEREDNAAKACVNYEYNGYKDWFLPSDEELVKLYENHILIKRNEDLLKKGFYQDGLHWSSSESGKYYYVWCAWSVHLDGDLSDHGRYNEYLVRPIRAF